MESVGNDAIKRQIFVLMTQIFSIIDALEILGLQNGSTKDDARQAYKDLIRIWHPDRYQHDPRLAARADEMTKKLNRAYDFLETVGANSAGRFVDERTHSRTNASSQSNSNGRSQHKDEQSCSPQESAQYWRASAALKLKALNIYLRKLVLVAQSRVIRLLERIRRIDRQSAVELTVYPSILAILLYTFLFKESSDYHTQQKANDVDAIFVESKPTVSTLNERQPDELADSPPKAMLQHQDRFPQKRLFAKSIADFDKAIRENSSIAEHYLGRGKAHIAEGEPELAIIDLDVALKLDPTSGLALRQRAKAFAKLRNFDRFIEDSLKAIHVDPLGEVIPAYENTSTLSTGSGTYELRKEQNKPQGNNAVQLMDLRYFNEGNAELEKKKWDAAIEKYDIAIKLNPEFAEAHLNRAIARFGTGIPPLTDLWDADIAKVLDDLNRAITIRPDYADAYFNRAIITIIRNFFDEGYFRRVSTSAADFSSVVPDLTRSIAIAPQSIHAYEKRGKILFSLNRFEEAFFDFNKVVGFQPQAAKGLLTRGVALLHLEEFDAAIEDLSAAIAIEPAWNTIYLLRGLAFLREGKIDQAIADYTEGLRRTDEYSNIGEVLFFNRGNAYLKRGDWKRAIMDYSEPIRVYSETVKKYPDNWRSHVSIRHYEYAYFNRGIAHAKETDFVSSVSDYSEAIHLNPKLLRAYLNRGAAFLTMGEHEKAEADFAKAKQLLMESETLSR